jgi:putative ABC transport system permease protein
MNTTYQKLWGDFRENPGQLLLVMLAIAIGALALSTAFSARAVMTREMERNYRGTSPADVTFWFDSVPPLLARIVANWPGVGEAEPRRLVRARAKINATHWRPLRLFVIDDFTRLRVSTFRTVQGKSVPGLGEALVERSALPVLHVRLGDSLTVRVPGGRARKVRVSGLVHDAGQAPGWQDNAGYAYVSPETAQWLGAGEPFDELQLTLSDGRARVDERAAEWTRLLARQGWLVRRVEVSEGQHPHADQMRTMLLLLTFFFVFAIALSGTLVANVLTGLLARQTRQIGVMRAVGGTGRAVAGLYGRLVLMLTLVGVVVGLPLGAWVADAFCTVAAEMLNLELIDRTVPPVIQALEISIGLAVPLGFAAVPLLRILRQPARQALQFSGVSRSARARNPWFARFGTPSVRLAIQNAFRQRGRLFRTVAALSVGGAVLLTALNLYRAIERAMDASLLRRGDAIDLRLLRPLPADSLRRWAETVPGVLNAEPWGSVRVSVERADGSAGTAVGSALYTLLAAPANSRYAPPVVTVGRWPKPDEPGVLIVSKGIQNRMPYLQPGASVTLLLRGRRFPVRVTTVIEEIAEPALYTTPATLNQLLGQPGLAGALRVQTEKGRQNEVAATLEERLVNRGAFPLVAMTHAILRQSMLDHIVILLLCLTSAAGAVLLVGALGMGASLSLNILERSREIGVMRAMGGTRADVFRLLLTESLVMTVLSVGLAIGLSLPLTALAGRVIGAHGLYVTLPFLFRLDALVLWLAVAGTVTIVTVGIAARRNLRAPVREVLAYE